MLATRQVEFDPLPQTGEQGRTVAGNDRLHEELVLVNQPEVGQRARERHATHPQAIAGLLLELLDRLPQVSRISSAFQSTLVKVLNTTYFFA